MAWIELHQTLPRHPKLARLASRLRVTRAQAAGHLTFLWLWALDYAPHGDLSALEPAEISAAADFCGAAEAFVDALKQSQWIDGDGKIHDWEVYAGRLIEIRKKDAKRKRKVRRMSDGCPPDGERTAHVPNPTKPNNTEQDLKRLNDAKTANGANGEHLGPSRSSFKRPVGKGAEKALMQRLRELLGEDEMARAGGHWRKNHVRKHPDLITRAIADVESSVREGREIENRGAYLEDIIKRFRS